MRWSNPPRETGSGRRSTPGHGGRNWAWPTRGAAWIYPAVLVLRLMEAGHSAEDADAWARRFPSWSAVPRTGVEMFSAANASAWAEIADNDPLSWKREMAKLARTWVAYWRTR